MVRHEVGRQRTLVVIPAYNEAKGLAGVLADLQRRCPEYDVLVVDDGSEDATAEVADACGVGVARLPFNLGIGGALRTGFRYAVAHGYERAIQFDADGQHDPDEIAKLSAALDDGADMVVGSRFAPSAIHYQVGRLRWGAMRAMRMVVRLLSGRSFTDTSSGFRAFSERALRYFARTYPVEYMESVEALLLACYAGLSVVEVPVRMKERAAGLPSNRSLKLVYHYVRLMIVLVSTASRQGRRARELPT